LATPKIIDDWADQYESALSTGLLCRFTPTIDVDIQNQEAAEAIEALARERFEDRGYFLVRIGQPPKRAVPLRTDSPFTKITRIFTAPDGSEQKIEILANGQQVVVSGIHEKTGKPYTWFGGDLSKIRQTDLPYVTQVEAGQFIADAAQLLVHEYGYTEA